MLKDIRAELIDFLRGIPGIIKSDTYRGEFEEDGEWVPVIPCALTNFTLINPSVITADTVIARNRYGIDIYIADRTDAAQITEYVSEEINGSDITIDDNIYRIKIVEIGLLGFIKSIEVWRIKIQLI